MFDDVGRPVVLPRHLVLARKLDAHRPSDGLREQRRACAAKPAPRVTYRAPGRCGEIDELHKIKLGTLDDMLKGREALLRAAGV